MGQRILLMDDSPLVVDAIREALEPFDVQVEDATDLTSIDHSELGRFDLILIDVLMPAKLGDEVAMVIRQRSMTAPIVLLSSLPDPELAERVSEAGIAGYVSKRHGVDSVVTEIRTWLTAAPQRPQKEA